MSRHPHPVKPRPSSGDRPFALAIAVAAATMTINGGCGGAEPASVPPTSGGLAATALLSGGDSEGFARATAPRPFVFPADHGPHADFRTEWWYFTGMVQGRATDGTLRRFGYQFTIFRQALTAHQTTRDSRWASRDLYMAHLAVSDVDGDPRRTRFHAFQRFSRDGLALAGAQATPFAVWVDSWRIDSTRRPQGAGGNDIFPLHLRAREVLPATQGTAIGGAAAVVEIDLVVEPGRGPIAQGEHGWSVKGTGAGNASFYYSCTRLPTRGRLTLGTQTIPVEGMSWLDREWSTSALDPEVAGWDWVGAHLDDGRDLMFYRLRTWAGAAAPASRVTLIDRDGQTHSYAPDAFSLTATGQWTSPDGKARYPAAFHLQLPKAALDLTLSPLLPDQELRLAVRYWEGAIALAGTSAGRPLTGTGYLELTGYAPPAPAPPP